LDAVAGDPLANPKRFFHFLRGVQAMFLQVFAKEPLGVVQASAPLTLLISPVHEAKLVSLLSWYR
jgi:hypothetical protein